MTGAAMRREGEDAATSAAIKREPQRLEVAYRQRQVYTETRAFAAAAERLLPLLGRAAGVLSRGDAQLAQDMVQEALIDLWEFDITRFAAQDELVLKKALYDRMKMVRLRERMDWGMEWREEDEVGGEQVLEPSEEMRRALDSEDDDSSGGE